MAPGGALQVEVRRTMLDAGGYWRPLAAVARLLEELGELVELLEARDPGDPDLAGELADLWIITTALADQFLIDVPDPVGPAPARPARAASTGGGLVLAAGQIARVINFYDGPKTPRRPGELPSLAAVTREFHVELELLSARLGIDLARAVGEKLMRIRASGDMERFARAASDPATAPILGARPPELSGLRLWGGPADAAAPAEELARALAPSLTSFTKAAVAEGLAAYVIGAPEPAGSEALARWQAGLFDALRLLDPKAASEPYDEGLSFNGMRLNASIVALGDEASAAIGARALLVLAAGDGSVLPRPAGDLP